MHSVLKNLQAGLGVLALGVSIGGSAHAYTTTATTSTQQTIRWRAGQKLFLAGNPTGRDSVDPETFRSLVVNGLQQWKRATRGIFDFDYWQGTDPKTFIPNLLQNGLSSVFFASNANDGSGNRIDPSVIGYTQVWYNDTSGEIIEADVILNDQNFELTTNPKDTSSTHTGGLIRQKVYLGNILTHELGHAIGLSHSGNINASMLYVEFSEQSKIGCDDWAGARHLYPVPNGGTGSLQGTALSPQGDPLPGAQITAISHERGIPIASVISDQSGHFNFGALEAGDVSLYLETFQGSDKSIPARMKAQVTALCNGQVYPTSFITAADGHTLEIYSVKANQVNDLGTISTSCNTMSDSQNLYAGNLSPASLVDVNQTGAPRLYHYFANGPFQITGLGYMLLSSVSVNLQVYDQNHMAVPVQMKSPLYQASSLYSIPDTSVTGNFVGDLYVEVTPKAIPNSYLPNSMLKLNAIPFYVMNFYSGDSTQVMSDLPDNARCAMSEDFAAYTSPSGSPVRFAATQTTHDAAGFCGSANADLMNPQFSGARRHGGSGVPLGSVLGWFFPFFTAFFTQFYLRWLYSRKQGAKL